MSPQQNEFASRLSRIESGVGSSKTTLYVGMDESYAVSYRQRGQNGGASDRGSGRLMKVAFAALIGVAANIAARWTDFALNGLSDGTESVDGVLIAQFVMALVAASILGMVFGIGVRAFAVARVFGIVVGMVGLHNLVHVYPKQFEVVFSNAWVSQIVSTTATPSVLWRGASIAI